MTDAKQTSEPEAFCYACDYPLKGLTGQRCPECGTPFDLTDPLTYASHPGQRLERLAGTSLIQFGFWILLGTVLVGIFAGSLTCDCTLIIAIALGDAVKNGKRGATIWALLLMAYYTLGGLVLITLLLTGVVPTIRIWGGPFPSALAWLGLVVGAGVIGWAAWNVVLLYRVLKAQRRTSSVRERVADLLE